MVHMVYLKEFFFSFPCVCKNGQYSIVQGLKISQDVAKLMKISADELLEEKKRSWCSLIKILRFFYYEYI